MKSVTFLFAAAMSMSGLAMAQSAKNPGVTEITDPAKIAAIEQHAKELAAGGGQSTMPMAGDHGDMKMHKGGMHHKKHRAMHHRAMKKAQDKAAPDAPMATESKG